MILVTGATGRVGYRLMEALADARADATAMVRVEAKAADLPGTARSVVATLASSGKLGRPYSMMNSSSSGSPVSELSRKAATMSSSHLSR